MFVIAFMICLISSTVHKFTMFTVVNSVYSLLHHITYKYTLIRWSESTSDDNRRHSNMKVSFEIKAAGLWWNAAMNDALESARVHWPESGCRN